MANLLSPGVESKETTTQNTVVQNATGRAALVGKFQWGPAFQTVQITNEVELAEIFGYPDNATADYFMSAANFLQYGNDLRVVRAINEDTAKNSSPLANQIKYTITAPGSNYEVGDSVKVKFLATVVEETGIVTKVGTTGQILSVFIPSGKIISYAKSIGQYPDLSDSWTVEVVSTASGISGAISINSITTDSAIMLTDPDTAGDAIKGTTFQESVKALGLPAIAAMYPGETGDQIEVEIVSKSTYDASTLKTLPMYPLGGTRSATAKQVFGYGPETDDQYCIIVRRNDTIVENMILSTKPGDRDVYNSNVYMDDFFSKGSSSYIFASAMNWPKGFSGIIKLSGGLSSNETVTAGDLMLGWDKFADPETLYINSLIAGAVAGETLEIASTVQKHVVAIADSRRDCLAMVSPPREILVNVKENRAIDNLVNWRTAQGAYDENNFNVSSTYFMIDGNYKYQYDKYNDVNRWIPFAADIAGLCARTDQISNPWMSPAGLNRGQLLNVNKVAIEPSRPGRDRLYQESINPIISEEGGYVLWGDKTGTKVQSPFDRVNVRRLFNMVKKAIGDASKSKVFEINNAFSRNSFFTETSQYLAGIKTDGGVYDFRVICDTTNNTPAVIDRNEFVAVFRLKPARSINFITLNFVADATGTNFDEVIGKS